MFWFFQVFRSSLKIRVEFRHIAFSLYGEIKKQKQPGVKAILKILFHRAVKHGNSYVDWLWGR
jgi:hypothetical protein